MRCKGCNTILNEKELLVDDELCDECLTVSNQEILSIDDSNFGNIFDDE